MGWGGKSHNNTTHTPSNGSLSNGHIITHVLFPRGIEGPLGGSPQENLRGAQVELSGLHVALVHQLHGNLTIQKSNRFFSCAAEQTIQILPILVLALALFNSIFAFSN